MYYYISLSMESGIYPYNLSYSVRRGIEYSLIHTPGLDYIYWNFAPKYYKYQLNPDVIELDIPINPFSIIYVDVDDVDKFSSIAMVSADRIGEIGSVNSGKWDRSEQSKRTLYTADKLTNTVFYNSIKAHFNDKVAWEDTKLVEQVISNLSKDKPAWHGCQTKKEILKRCRDIDELYEKIRDNGYKTQFELIQDNNIQKFKNSGFINSLINEVTVDIGRDGDLLFVDGRHRLSIAKTLDMDKIPVFVFTRHKKWIDKLKEHYDGKIELYHPDTKSLSMDNNLNPYVRPSQLLE